MRKGRFDLWQMPHYMVAASDKTFLKERKDDLCVRKGLNHSTTVSEKLIHFNFSQKYLMINNIKDIF